MVRQLLIPLLATLVVGCRTYRERDVLGWQRIQNRLTAAEQDGLSDTEAEDLVQEILTDAELCVDAGPRLGRFTLALRISQEMTDPDTAAALRSRFMPEAIEIGMANHAHARLLLLNLDHRPRCCRHYPSHRRHPQYRPRDTMTPHRPLAILEI